MLKKHYEKDYNYYLEILKSIEKTTLLHSMKKAYILANSEVLDQYQNSRKEELEEKTINFIPADVFIKQRRNETHSN